MGAFSLGVATVWIYDRTCVLCLFTRRHRYPSFFYYYASGDWGYQKASGGCGCIGVVIVVDGGGLQGGQGGGREVTAVVVCLRAACPRHLTAKAGNTEGKQSKVGAVCESAKKMWRANIYFAGQVALSSKLLSIFVACFLAKMSVCVAPHSHGGSQTDRLTFCAYSIRM